MEKKYYCKYCDYNAKVKSSFNKHLKTKKHLESTQSQQKVNIESTKSQQKVNIKLIKNKDNNCKYCNKSFTTKQAMYRHIKYTCSQNTDESIKELCRLLNDKEKILKEQGAHIKHLYERIEKLSSKLQINNINNGIITNNVNIQLLDYDKTDYSHLTDNDYVNCIKDCNYSIKTLIEKVHFNNNKPENMNIYISSIKGNYVMVYKNQQWQILDRKSQLDDLYEFNEIILSDWYKEYKNKYPDMINSMKLYLKNSEENEIINEVKKEILLMLYNNRKIVMPTLSYIS